MIKFSIITVCYNAEQYIKRTIQSVLEQDMNDYEYIIKDGKSADSTMEIVHAMLSENDHIHLISETDNGIYDAMNAAIDQAKGEYLFFLNAGDCFANASVLNQVKMFLERTEADVAYGNIIQIHGDEKKAIRTYGKTCSRKMYFLSGDCICHQAMFAKRELFFDKKFDTQYKVCADKEWQLFHICNKISFVPMGFEIASVPVEGFSTNHLSDFERESMQCIEKYCKNMAWIYRCIDWMKHNKFCVKVLRAVGNFLFVRSEHE